MFLREVEAAAACMCPCYEYQQICHAGVVLSSGDNTGTLAGRHGHGLPLRFVLNAAFRRRQSPHLARLLVPP